MSRAGGLIPRDRSECHLCQQDRDHHLDECLYRTHDISVKALREKYREEHPDEHD